jgi:hypothetical protein
MMKWKEFPKIQEWGRCMAPPPPPHSVTHHRLHLIALPFPAVSFKIDELLAVKSSLNSYLPSFLPLGATAQDELWPPE